MSKLSLYAAWNIMRETSAYHNGNPDYQEQAEAHAKTVSELSESEQADFRDKAELIKTQLEAVQEVADTITQEILEQLGLDEHLAKWTAADLAKFLGIAQTKGVYSEYLALQLLANGDVRVLFDMVEPEDEEEGEAEVAGD